MEVGVEEITSIDILAYVRKMCTKQINGIFGQNKKRENMARIKYICGGFVFGTGR